MNYFEIFNLPVSYQLDSDALAPTYRQLQRQFHPDNFATASESDKLQAVQRAADINDAYRTLKDPVLRAQHLLKIQFNIDIRKKRSIQDPEFLMQQMELHEAVENAHDFAALDRLAEKIKGMQQVWLSQLEASLAEQDSETATQHLIRLSFVRKLLSQIEKKEDSLYE